MGTLAKGPRKRRAPRQPETYLPPNEAAAFLREWAANLENPRYDKALIQVNVKLNFWWTDESA